MRFERVIQMCLNAGLSGLGYVTLAIGIYQVLLRPLFALAGVTRRPGPVSNPPSNLSVQLIEVPEEPSSQSRWRVFCERMGQREWIVIFALVLGFYYCIPAFDSLNKGTFWENVIDYRFPAFRLAALVVAASLLGQSTDSFGHVIKSFEGYRKTWIAFFLLGSV